MNNFPFPGGKGVTEEAENAVGLGEIRFVRFNEKTASVLLSYEGKADVLLVFANEEILPALSESLAGLTDDFLQSDESGAGVFTKNGFDVYLSPYEEEKRLIYYKNVCFPRLKRRGFIRERLVFRGIGCDKKRFDECVKKCAAYQAEGLGFSYAEQYDDVRMEVTYDAATPKTLLDNVSRVIAGTFSEELYAMDDTPIEKRLCELLKVRGRKISVAESFTGGGVGRRIVSVPGASEVYFEGLNTYDGTAKIKRLNVSPYTLNTFGAVSDQTAYEMCAGLLSTGDCGAAISTTGLAGPKSDDSGLPVGLCFLAAGVDGKIYIARHVFSGTREEITEKAINHALFWAYKHLK